MNQKTYRLIIWFAVVTLSIGHIFSTDVTQFEDVRIREAKVIAVIDVTEVKDVGWGEVVYDGKTSDTLLMSYVATVVEKIKGEIPSSPFIQQFTAVGDMNQMEKGLYLVFMEQKGFIYFPLDSGTPIVDGKLRCYKQPFQNGDYGPYFEQVPLEKAVADIKAILAEKKKKRK